jgi:hypothetical protein
MVFHRSIRKTFQLGLICGALLGLGGCTDFDEAMIELGILANLERHGGSDVMLVQIEEEGLKKAPAEHVRFMPLGVGVLIPDVVAAQRLPREDIGPYELRGETLAGALQFILSDFDIPLAVESDLALQRTVTVANLNGRLDLMVEQLCSMSDLYCMYKKDVLSVRAYHDYAVTIPPSGASVDIIDDVAKSIKGVIGKDVVLDRSTRTILYQSTRKQAASLSRYFEKLRANMALISYEVGIWSVQLDPIHRQGVLWESLLHDSQGRAKEIAGVYASEYGAPVSIGLPGDIGDAYGMYDISTFLAGFGEVKALSKPTISVMSGANGLWHTQETGVAPEDAHMVKIALGSLWDGASVFSDLDIELEGKAQRHIKTQLRMRPGDSMIMAGMMKPRIIGKGRQQKEVVDELVIMLRPKVVVYKARKDYYHISGVPRPSDTENDDTDIWQSIGDEPMILVPESAPWPPLPRR